MEHLLSPNGVCQPEKALTPNPRPGPGPWPGPGPVTWPQQAGPGLQPARLSCCDQILSLSFSLAESCQGQQPGSQTSLLSPVQPPPPLLPPRSAHLKGAIVCHYAGCHGFARLLVQPHTWTWSASTTGPWPNELLWGFITQEETHNITVWWQAENCKPVGWSCSHQSEGWTPAAVSNICTGDANTGSSSSHACSTWSGMVTMMVMMMIMIVLMMMMMMVLWCDGDGSYKGDDTNIGSSYRHASSSTWTGMVTMMMVMMMVMIDDGVVMVMVVMWFLSNLPCESWAACFHSNWC